jgi:hypothetical protein
MRQFSSLIELRDTGHSQVPAAKPTPLNGQQVARPIVRYLIGAVMESAE